GLLVRRFGGGPGIHEILGDAAVHEHDALTWHSFAIERSTLLQGMINVIGDADVLAEELLAHAFVQAGALVRECGGGKIIKKKTDKVENSSGFEDDSVTTGGKLACVHGEMRFFAGSGGNLVFPDGQVAGAANGAGPIFGGEGGGVLDEAVYPAIALLARYRQEVGDFRLAVRKGERSFDRSAKRVFIDAIGGGARGSP